MISQNDIGTTTPLEDLRIASNVLFMATANLLDVPINLFSEEILVSKLKAALGALCLGYIAYGREIPEDLNALWEDTTEPEDDLIKAKLVRYASNLYCCTMAYPETVLESNLDYDLRQYLTFLHLFATRIGFDLEGLAQEILLDAQ